MRNRKISDWLAVTRDSLTGVYTLPHVALLCCADDVPETFHK